MITPPDFTKALQIAGRLTTDAVGQTVPDAGFRQELRYMQLSYEERSNGGRGSTTPPLDEAQKARVRQLRAQGKPLTEIATLLGTSYSRVQKVDGTANGERAPNKTAR